METLDALLVAGWRSLEEVAHMTEDDMKAAGMKGFLLKKLKALKESLPSVLIAAGNIIFQQSEPTQYDA